jgi:hypothetical protein
MALTLFPQRIIEQAGENGQPFPTEEFKKVISSMFDKIFPYMINDIIRMVPYQTDPSVNTLSQIFFKSMEKQFFSRCLQIPQD